MIGLTYASASTLAQFTLGISFPGNGFVPKTDSSRVVQLEERFSRCTILPAVRGQVSSFFGNISDVEAWRTGRGAGLGERADDWQQGA